MSIAPLLGVPNAPAAPAAPPPPPPPPILADASVQATGAAERAAAAAAGGKYGYGGTVQTSPEGDTTPGKTTEGKDLLGG
jgi:hypothetical protein